MPQTPFFSVITVTFNAEREIGRTTDSLFSQTIDDFEWIVVDGFSKDRTVELASRHARRGIDKIISEPDDGIYDAMNKGLALASGQFVNFLNAGDCYAASNTLEIVRAHAAQGGDVIYGDTIHPISPGITRHRPSARGLEPFPLRIPFCHQAMFTRRSVHGQFDCAYRLAADYDLMARLLKSGAVAVRVPEALSVNSVDPRSASIRGRTETISEYRRIWRDVVGISPWRARFEYAKYMLRMRIVAGAASLPPRVASLIPPFIRRRLY